MKNPNTKKKKIFHFKINYFLGYLFLGATACTLDLAPEIVIKSEEQQHSWQGNPIVSFFALVFLSMPFAVQASCKKKMAVFSRFLKYINRQRGRLWIFMW